MLKHSMFKDRNGSWKEKERWHMLNDIVKYAEIFDVDKITGVYLIIYEINTDAYIEEVCYGKSPLYDLCDIKIPKLMKSGRIKI